MMRLFSTSLTAKFLAIFLFCLDIPDVASFSFLRPSPRCRNDYSMPRMTLDAQEVGRSKARIRMSSFYNDFDDNGDGDNQNDDDSDCDQDTLFASLRDRLSAFDERRKIQLDGWKSPPVQTQAVPIPGDWVRRVAMDTNAGATSSVAVTAANTSKQQHLHAIVGGASGSLYLVNIALDERQEKPRRLLGTLQEVHESRGDESDKTISVLSALYGEFDGGGIIALAMKDTMVVSSGREGSVHISKVLSETETDDNGNAPAGMNQLEAVGKIPQLYSSIVTSLVFDEAETMLWVGSFDDDESGVIRGYLYAEDDNDELHDTYRLESAMKKAPLHTIHSNSGILSLSLANEIGCGVAATEADGIVLFSTQDGTVLGTWNPFAGNNKSDGEYARTAAVIQNDEAPRAPPMEIPDPTSEDPNQTATLVASPIWSVIIGGSLGNLYQRRLTLDIQGNVSKKRAFDTLSPVHSIPEKMKHGGSIVCLTSPGPGVLVSAAQDASIRIWNSSYQQNYDEVGDSDNDMRDEMGGSKPNCLYALAGYKVWLGSLVVLKDDMNMLISDGADNAIVTQVFKKILKIDYS